MICFAWVGIPQYAARCIGAFVRSTNERVVVIATRPVVPVKGMEELCACEFNWVDTDQDISMRKMCGEIPRCLIVSGWIIPTFNRVRDEVKSDGGRVFSISDGNISSTIVSILRAVRFRLMYRGKYDGFFVPGKEGAALVRYFGYDVKHIAKGVYAADASLFHDGKPMSKRQKRMIFVGRMHPVKNVLRLCEAFLKSEAGDHGWILDMYGCGELTEAVSEMINTAKRPIVHLHDFLQPEQLAEEYRKSRIFILPSVREPWGVVVHEAALSGCILLLSTRVGAAADFVGKRNGVLFNPMRIGAIIRAINKVVHMSDDELELAHEESIMMSRNASLEKFCMGVDQLCGKMLST